MASVAPREDETLDTLREGQLRLLQRRSGYRFNLDAVLLAGFAVRGLEPTRPVSVVDLGAGCGVVSLLMSSWRPAWRITAVERQPGLAALARRNVRLNESSVEIFEADWRSLPEGVKAKLVVSNPPYYPPESGRLCSNEERANARWERHGDVKSLAKAAAGLVAVDGVVKLIHSASRLSAVLDALQAVELSPVVLRFVHPRLEEAANTVLIEARPKVRSPLEVLAPLVVHGEAKNGFSEEVARLLSADAPS